ncbi:MAG: MMPL family transporter, partial [Clostridiales bacterium]|nr:MMPL family transporter [Clostridiales bacterium]
HYSRMVISVNADYEGTKTFSLVEKIRDTAEKHYPDSYYLTGQGVCAYDLMNTVTSDMVKINLIAISAVLIVLLLTMRSVSLPVILVLSIEAAIWLNLSIPYFESKKIFYTAYLIISSVQLGATVDYAILFTERYKEFRQAAGKKHAVAQTVSTVSVSILTSGIVLTVLGFLLGYISTHGVISQLGFLLGRGSLLSLAVTLLVLPGLLYIFDGLVQRTTRGTRFLNQLKEARLK